MSRKIKSCKYKQLLKSARLLFFRFGIHRVTVKEICLEAKVSKVTFYKYFANKTELLLEVIHKIQEDKKEDFAKILEKDVSFLDKIELIIAWKNKYSEMLGRNFCDDFLQLPSAVFELLNQCCADTSCMMSKFFDEGQKLEYIRQDIQPDFLLHILNHLWQLPKNSPLRNQYENPAELYREILKFFFYGILRRK